MDQTIKTLVDKHTDEVIALRRHFHIHPEASGKEYQTQRRIMEELAGLGLSPRKAAGTGVIAEIRGALPGKTVAVRADIDALLLQDEIDRPYRSTVPGVCHACGHDGHAAMLIGLAKVMCERKDTLAGNIRLLFQPHEEAFPGGARAMIAEGAMEGVDAVLGAHLWQPIPVGCLGISYGRLMAAPDEFTITVTGRGGHGSMPHQTVDALLTAAQVVTAVNTVVSRNVDPLESVALSFGMFRAGEVFNIIPDTAVMKGTVRSFDDTVRYHVWDRIEQIVKGICDAAGATYQMERTYGYPPVVNHPDIARLAAEAGAETLGRENVSEIKPCMGGEDFSYYQKLVPGMFMFVGAGNPEKGIVHPHHHPRFDIDEAALGFGLEIMSRTVLKILASR